MTKEDLEEMCKYTPRNQEEAIFIEAIGQFFESNVCIPKGENRHPYADVLHELLEGENVEVYNKIHRKWKYAGRDCIYDGEYRIKPSEPIYEWQWKFKHTDSNATWDGYTIYATDEQFEKIKMDWMKYEKDEETKRIRQ